MHMRRNYVVHITEACTSGAFIFNWMQAENKQHLYIDIMSDSYIYLYRKIDFLHLLYIHLDKYKSSLQWCQHTYAHTCR